VADGPDLLLAGERVVAVSLSFVANGTAHLWKIAHDEALRRDAPGLVLEEAIIRACHETGFADRLDSLAQPGSVLDELYPDREAIGDLVIGLDPALDPARLQRWAEAEQSRRDTLRRFKTIARTTRDRLLALRPPR
jgi:hypothetical protein